MSEVSTEQLTPRENANRLQAQFGRYIESLHNWAGNAFDKTGSRVMAPDRDTKEAESILAESLLNKFDSFYRSVPEGYHLAFGLSPLKWHEFQRDEELRLLTSREMTPLGPQYWLNVARHVENPATMEPNMRRLNLSAIGTNDPENPSAKLEPVFISKDGLKRTAKSIFPEDILSVKVVENPRK